MSLRAGHLTDFLAVPSCFTALPSHTTDSPNFFGTQNHHPHFSFPSSTLQYRRPKCGLCQITSRTHSTWPARKTRKAKRPCGVCLLPKRKRARARRSRHPVPATSVAVRRAEARRPLTRRLRDRSRMQSPRTRNRPPPPLRLPRQLPPRFCRLQFLNSLARSMAIGCRIMAPMQSWQLCNLQRPRPRPRRLTLPTSLVLPLRRHLLLPSRRL